jgi:hypothetical protein
MSQKSVTDELQNKLDKASIKTVNGQSLLGGGNIQLTGEDMLLEHGAGLDNQRGGQQQHQTSCKTSSTRPALSRPRARRPTR